MPNNPITDEQLAELDRWREAAPVNKWAVGKSPRNGRVQVYNGQIQVCAVWSTFTNPAQGTAQYIAAMHNAYPALRQRLTDAESRLAEAERERDELEALRHRIDSLQEAYNGVVRIIRNLDRDALCDWHDEFGCEEYLAAWLAARDAQQRRDGVLEGLGMALIILSASDDPEVAIKQAAQRLREGK